MKCIQCGIENPKQAKFCKKCGASLEIRTQCLHCDAENSGGSIFCTECGEKMAPEQKSVKGTQRKCRNCGQFNKLDVPLCAVCGEVIIKVPKENVRRRSSGPSVKTIALVVGIIILFGLLVEIGTTVFRRDRSSQAPSSSDSVRRSSVGKVDEAQVIAVAKNFKCACGGCGEDPLETCTCDMPKGAVEEKNFIREKLSEGLTVEQVIELVDKKYGHRV
ncbi:MAG: zinc ribbon domain-containing protein [Desulfatirhabdiaceae bacterium]|nr:zinc ribbon domain-containing protein [Desulfatirhabdiaceae bacterium]